MKDPERLSKTVAGRYTIDGMIGTGGMGVVYAATHWLTGQRVAIKLLREEVLNDHELERRFVQEARAAADLHHPNVVRLLDLDRDDDERLFMVLELLAGETLEDLLVREYRIGLSAACEVLLPIMHAVAAAHDRGIVHRDLEPTNIFLHSEANGCVIPKLLDFGIARVVEARVSAVAAFFGRGTASLETRTGQILGTPDHMSGVSPFQRDDLVATMTDVATASYTPLDVCCPDLPRASALQGVIGRALTPDVAKRTPTMRAMLEELSAAAEVDAAAVLARFLREA